MTSDRGNGLFGIYIHWPFCLAKCPYCDFNSHVSRGPIDEDRFIAALKTELRHFAALTPGREVGSIFFGGGTPSLMSAHAVATLLDAIAGHWTIAPDAEISLEANPTSAEADRFRGFRTAGINRVSLGVQALEPGPLARLGRLHTVDEAIAAVRLAQSVFERTSFDLIYARPGQTLAGWRAELGHALALEAGHLSLYQLTIEQGTRFFELREAGRLDMPGAGLAADLYLMTGEMCATAGLPAYEISNHARPGHQSEHNLLYWRYGEYVGVGPGAHGRLLIKGVRHATATSKSPIAWAGQVEKTGNGLVASDPLTWEEEADEFLVMGLRLAEGIDIKRYRALSGRTLAPGQIAGLTQLGFLETLAGGNLRVTAKGFVVLDAVVADLAM